MSWTRKPLEEVAEFCLGKMLDENKNKGTLLPYLANINVRWGSFELDDLRQMRFEERELDRCGLRSGDLVMCEGGEPGRCAIWQDQIPGMMFQKALHRIRPHEIIDSRFLFYLFLKMGRNNEFSGLFTGATIKHLPKEKLAKTVVAFPEIEIQRMIADRLSAYDALIENNRRRIALLEKAARLLYEEWFVRFRFPGHEHTKFINGLPDGWKPKSFTEVIEVAPKTPIEKGRSSKYVPMSSLSTSGMTADPADFEERTKPTNVHFMNGDTLLAGITPCLENGKTAFVNFLEDGEVACGSTEFIVLRGKEVSPFFAYCLARSENLRGCAIVSMIGASGRQRVQESCFDEYPVPLAPDAILRSFDGFVEPAFQQIQKLTQANQRLIAARDLLLPRLMSGEVEV